MLNLICSRVHSTPIRTSIEKCTEVYAQNKTVLKIKLKMYRENNKNCTWNIEKV